MTPDAQPPRIVAVESCPACKGRAFYEAGRAPGLTCDVGGRAFVQPDYVVRECSACGLIFRTPNLSPDELGAYYAAVDYRKWEVAGYFPTERAALERLRKLPRGARLLDFGCSSGRLLAPLAQAYECYGYEINAAAARVAEAKGLSIISQPAFETGSCGRFDAIVMSDVFEHLSAPVELMRKLIGLLKPQGELLIITGNADASACRLDPAQFWYFRNVEHLCMLNRRFVDTLAAELGVTLVAWRELSHYDTPIFERLLQSARHFAFWQFRHGTLLSKTLLPWVPVFRRARCWHLAPAYTASADHVLAVLKAK